MEVGGSAMTSTPWRWNLLPSLFQVAFQPRDETPVPLWARKWVFLSRRITTKPGYYDYEEFPWTYEYQDFFRTRTAFEMTMPDGAIVLVDAPGPNVVAEEVQQVTWMKSSVAGVTEGALNGVRWIAKNDPHNVIFSIDNRVEAGNINEVRLQPSLRQLGEKVFTERDEDAGKFLLKLLRMLIYFIGSYSAGAFANKMAETCIGDELEEHGKTPGSGNSVDNLRSRLKSALRPLLILMSKPKLSGGPIHLEHDDGSCHVYEIPCPRCTAEAGGIPSGFQQLLRPQLRFDHCKTVEGHWDKRRILEESYFQCIHNPAHKILEGEKRWFNDRQRRRWRRTNFNATPGHISFQISDYYGYHPDTQWGRIALKIIKAKGNPVAMQGIRNHIDGLPWEQRATKTSVDDIMALRQPYKRGHFPRKPFALILGADVGLTYVSWVVLAFTRDGEAWLVDWGTETHPNVLHRILNEKRYICNEDGKSYRITLGYIDAKYRKREVHKACYLSARRLWPIAGLPAELSLRSISFNHIPTFPKWFGITVFVDRDAKHELYTERIQGWLKHRGEKESEPPNAPPLHFPEDLQPSEDMAKELCCEQLIQRNSDAADYLPDAAKEFVWKRTGPNHKGDGVKVAIVGYRWLTRRDAAPVATPKKPSPEDREREQSAIAAALADQGE
jgi:hypothetical protein